MTNEEAIKVLREINYDTIQENVVQATNMAISALEQPPLSEVLGEIKGEIEELIDWHDCPIEYDNGNDAWYREACNMAISIIDSHISGKEKE